VAGAGPARRRGRPLRHGVGQRHLGARGQPGIVDQTLNRIISEDDYYSGCYSRATVTAYGYDKAGNKGVAFGLQNLQKLGDGDRFSGRTAAEDDFDSVDDFVGEGEAGSDASFLD